MRAAVLYCLFGLIICVTACAEVPVSKKSPLIRVPMGIGLGISDVPCNEIKKSISTRLEELEIAFEWIDEEDGMLIVGSITEDIESNSAYSEIRQTYYLIVVCHDEVTTSIGGEAALEGLNADGAWVSISSIYVGTATHPCSVHFDLGIDTTLASAVNRTLDSVR